MTEKNTEAEAPQGREASAVGALVMGPPTRGPWVRVTARGLDVLVRVDDDLDAEIVRLTLDGAQRRRFGKAL